MALRKIDLYLLVKSSIRDGCRNDVCNIDADVRISLGEK